MPHAPTPDRSLLPVGFPGGWRGLGVGLLVVLAASVVLEPAHVIGGPVVCPVRLVTGLSCPGCGLLRSFTAMGSLDVAAAFAFHPFGPPLYVAVLLALAVIAGRVVTGRWPARPRRVDGIRRVAWVGLAAWLTWALWRVVA